MREQIEQRRAALITEHERGAAMLTRMDSERETLAQTLLRISGAIQLCEELLAAPPETGAPATEGDVHAVAD